jgi:hypothetical protein
MILQSIALCCLLISPILSACGGVPQGNGVAQNTGSLPASDTAPSPSAEPTPTHQADSPTPTGISSQADASPPDKFEPTQAVTTLTSGNPDLNFAQVVFVRVVQSGGGAWRFDVTVRHNDEGWDHYADTWQVVDLGGNLLGERILLHPHDTEQPFTRSQDGIEIPEGISQVVVRAKCNIHGFGGQEVLVDLTAKEGENFEVIRS